MYDPDAAVSITHGNTKMAKPPRETIEELRDQVHELQHRIAKCECGEVDRAIEPQSPFDAMSLFQVAA